MKAAKGVLAIVALCALSLAASVPARADGHGGHYHGGGYYHGGGHYYGHGYAGWGVYFGLPYYSGWYYPPYPYYYPYGYGYPYYPYYGGAAGVPSGPTTYVERGDQQAAPEAPGQNWWYYCPDSKTYYPYAKQCPGGWQKVAPQPPAQ
ncbi:MAG TPA: hypothetical protein VEH51_04590 [Burkholderiales bacterium]|nr:hypothetical protein [Burkholderiales bacterium]